jgi:murein DD-endopeptidase MepM/ murein hydrolase activator NlpD
LSENGGILRSKISMICRETNRTQRFSLSTPATVFGRWLCGHRPSQEHLGLKYFNLQSPFRVGQSVSLRAVSELDRAQDACSFRQSNDGDRALDPFRFWLSQSWSSPLSNLPNFSDSAASNPPQSLSRRSEFFRYGSDFLRYKSWKSKAQLSCSRAALYLAGGLLSQNTEGGTFLPGQGALSAFFLTASVDSQFSELLPWATLDQPWSTPLQVTTAIAVAIPLLIGSAQIQPLSLLQADSANRRDRPTAPANPATASRSETIASPTLKAQKPTGKIANIQSYVFPAKGELTSGYGWRWGRMHSGIDIAGPVGTPIVAAAAGKVITAGWDSTGFGNRVEIQHPDGTVTLYGHSNRILTHVGMLVRQGQPIAEMGSTGRSTGPHLHFQMYRSPRNIVNPMNFLSRQKLSQPPA